jgi:hypothetical protein
MHISYRHYGCIIQISRKKLVRVYDVHRLLKNIVVGNARIKYQSFEHVSFADRILEPLISLNLQ